MKKHISTRNQYQADFVKAFSRLCDRKQAWKAWTEFINLAAIEISNAFDPGTKDKEPRAKRYEEIVKTCTEQEREIYGELFRLTVEGLEANTNQDFLGDIFMALDLGNHWRGQFFTPYDICRAMAEISLPEAVQISEKHGYVTVCDPACGAGATLIAARNAFNLRKIGWDQVFYFAQDIDQLAGLMCYIQLSLLGCAGYVVIADSICNPVVGPVLLPTFNERQDAWVLPMTYGAVWQYRITAQFLDRLRAAVKPLEEPAQAKEYSENEAGQLMIF